MSNWIIIIIIIIKRLDSLIKENKNKSTLYIKIYDKKI